MGKSTENEGAQGAEDQSQSSEGTSQGEQQQTSSQDNQLVASLLESDVASGIISKLVEKGVASEFQKNKDKRLQQVDDNKSEITRLREKVEGKGMTFEDAEAQIQQENTQAEIQDQLAQVLQGKASDGDDTPKTWTEREAAILNSSAIDPRDPELKRFRDKFDDPDEYLKELPNKVWQMAKRPAGDEGSASGGQGTKVDEDLQAEYDKEMALIRRGDVKAITDLKKAYRKKGLEVW